jgi:hypothetical protein
MIYKCEMWDGNTLFTSLMASPTMGFEFPIVTEEFRPFWNGPIPIRPVFETISFRDPMMCYRNNEPVIIYLRKH